MDYIWHFSKASSQKSICTQLEFLDDCVEKRSWQRQHRHGQPLLFMSLSKLKNENTRLTPCLVRSFTKNDSMHFASINFFHMSFSSSSYIANVLVLFIGTSVFVEVGWKQLWTFGNSTRHPECRTSQHPSAYLGSAANETMNSVMEWLSVVSWCHSYQQKKYIEMMWNDDDSYSSHECFPAASLRPKSSL